jgi:hypothetical protein
MSKGTRREYIDAQRDRYQAAGRAGKGRILDELVEATGYNRKYAMGVLSARTPSASTPPMVSGCDRPKRGRRYTYTSATLKALVKVWEYSDRLCSKRLVPFLPEFLLALERHKELTLDDFTRAQLLSVSSATVDRHLSSLRQKDGRKGLCATKPGTLLKSQIPIRTFADWEDARPGFCEVDLVVHTDNTEGGDYLCTLVATDVCTGWTECRPLLRHDALSVRGALQDVRKTLPFPLLGIDSDNGSEFINALIVAYCKKEGITFTRGRPSKKNDQAYVEQKNGHIVRALVGYDRYEGKRAYNKLAALYHVSNPWINFYQPSQKLLEKHRDGAKVKKTYDAATTPFTRCLDSHQVTAEQKDALRGAYDGINPVQLRQKVQIAQENLWQFMANPESDSYMTQQVPESQLFM